MVLQPTGGPAVHVHQADSEPIADLYLHVLDQLSDAPQGRQAKAYSAGLNDIKFCCLFLCVDLTWPLFPIPEIHCHHSTGDVREWVCVVSGHEAC